MLSEIPSVDITRSLNPFLFAALTICFSFLDFLVSASSKNTNEEDDRKPSPVEKTKQIPSNVQLNAYEESDREEDSKKA